MVTEGTNSTETSTILLVRLSGQDSQDVCRRKRCWKEGRQRKIIVIKCSDNVRLTGSVEWIEVKVNFVQSDLHGASLHFAFVTFHFYKTYKDHKFTGLSACTDSKDYKRMVINSGHVIPQQILSNLTKVQTKKRLCDVKELKRWFTWGLDLLMPIYIGEKSCVALITSSSSRRASCLPTLLFSGRISAQLSCREMLFQCCHIPTHQFYFTVFCQSKRTYASNTVQRTKDVPSFHGDLILGSSQSCFPCTSWSYCLTCFR